MNGLKDLLPENLRWVVDAANKIAIVTAAVVVFLMVPLGYIAFGDSIWKGLFVAVFSIVALWNGKEWLKEGEDG